MGISFLNALRFEQIDGMDVKICATGYICIPTIRLFSFHNRKKRRNVVRNAKLMINIQRDGTERKCGN